MTDDRMPWLRWSQEQWDAYRSDVLTAIQRASRRGENTAALEACLALADRHIRLADGSELVVVATFEAS
jgi:hypothetical protein